MLFNTFILGLILGFLAGIMTFCLLGLLYGGRSNEQRVTRILHTHVHSHAPQELHHLYPHGEVRWEPTEQDVEAECATGCNGAPMRLATEHEANGCCNPVQSLQASYT